VVGINYPNKRGVQRRFEVELCKAGEPLELRPEPGNKADPQAVAVYSVRGVQIGYLPAERCARISALLGQGREVKALYQGHDEHRAWARIAYDGDTPILPPERLIEPEPDFWPDPTYDD
jgi:hypothetical protein